MSKIYTDENAISAPESDYLYILPSQLPNAGDGLYTAIDIYKDEIIAIYNGEILTDKEAQRRADSNNNKYFMNMHDGRILDSMRTAGFAKYANDAKGFSGSIYTNNAKISLDASNNICLIATRKIKIGEDIFCGYGNRYWENI